MAVLKCTICGGELEVNSDLTVGVCKYCNSTIVIPKELDRKGNLYNRAVFLRQNNEFDKAVSTYEDILKEDNLDAEAHWGLVLSKYGVEYVSDPRTHQLIPTCHRTQAESILSDPDYLAALEYSDIEARRVIEKEAKRISEIQAKILEISQKEPPYDIFICYKESDEFGNRTEDSTLTQEIYYELIKKGYIIFFARKTLESQLGTEYEPIIYAALSSAKVMIVLGTKPDHFTSVWVRNEWSRFLKMSRGTHKTIIPAYRGMSPYELPAELSALQSQDMSKIGFMQDLTDGIERCMRRYKGLDKQTSVEPTTVTALSQDRLVKNAETYLRLHNFQEAVSVYEKLTKDYPEDYRGWWGLIVSSTNNLSVASTYQNKVDTWFEYVKMLCPPKEYSLIEQRYAEYLELVAADDATAEMKRIKGMIDILNNSISVYKQQITLTEQEKTHQRSLYDSSVDQEKRSLGDLENKVRTAEEEYSSFRGVKKPLYIIGGIITGIIWLFLLAKELKDPDTGFFAFLAILIFICLLGIPVYLFICGADEKSYKKAINYAKDAVSNQQKRISDLSAQFQSFLKKKDGEIATAMDAIQNENEKIMLLNQYIDEKASVLKSFYHSERCKKIGVLIPFSGDTSLPEFASKISNNEMKNITCPACGSTILVSELDVQQRGTIQCSVCGSEIEIITKE